VKKRLLRSSAKGESPPKEKLAEVLQLPGKVTEQYLAHCLENGGAVSRIAARQMNASILMMAFITEYSW
jgi:hypothetical protein